MKKTRFCTISFILKYFPYGPDIDPGLDLDAELFQGQIRIRNK
jgi:hypothetical protein